MFKLILNSRLLIVFLIPLFLGSISFLSFQPFNLFFINFFILPTLFLIVTYINKRSKNTYRNKPYYINLFYVGYCFGIGFFLFGTYWISKSLEHDQMFSSLIPITIILIPLFLGIFYGLGILACGKFINMNLQSILLFSIAISSVDFIRSKVLSGFPWNLWAYSWSWFNEILQILNPIGLFAFNLITITFYLIPVILFLKKFKYKNLVIFTSLLLFFSNYIYGNYIINQNQIIINKALEKNDYINVKVVSPGFNLEYNLSEQKSLSRITKLIKYSNPEKSKETLFVWPEGSLSGKYFFEIKTYKKLFLENFSEKHLIVLGANTLDKKKNKFYNSFIIVNNKLDKKYQYNKMKLVPFGEFLPMNFFFEKTGLKKVTEGFGSFSKGEVNTEYIYKNLKILPLICYEIIFTELVQKINNTNNLLINISEDVWFGDTIGPRQHFAKSVFRAIESDSFLIRAANKGTSAIINNKGQVIKSLKRNEVGNIEYKLPIIQKKGGNKNDLIFFVLLFTYGIIFLSLKKND